MVIASASRPIPNDKALNNPLSWLPEHSHPPHPHPPPRALPTLEKARRLFVDAGWNFFREYILPRPISQGPVHGIRSTDVADGVTGCVEDRRKRRGPRWADETDVREGRSVSTSFRHDESAGHAHESRRPNRRKIETACHPLREISTYIDTYKNESPSYSTFAAVLIFDYFL